MLAELYRRDKKGFHHKRAESDKIILTCRYVSVLVASILKTKGIPCRVRSGFAPYFNLYGERAADHWINEYWNAKKERWVAIDVDGSLDAKGHIY
jgi:transglutaminase-like putative cysteine protease